MIGVVLLSKRLGVNPDNVATPVAASLGDLTTLALLSVVGKFVFMVVEGELSYLVWDVSCIHSMACGIRSSIVVLKSLDFKMEYCWAEYWYNSSRELYRIRYILDNGIPPVRMIN